MRGLTLLLAAVAAASSVGLAEMVGVPAPFPWLVGLAFGVVIGAVLLFTERFGPSESFRSREFRRAANLGDFLDITLRDQVDEAIQLWRDCEQIAAAGQATGLKSYFGECLKSVEQATRDVHALAFAIDRNRQRMHAERALCREAVELRDLERRWLDCWEDEERQALEDEIAARRFSLDSQRELRRAGREAQTEVEKTLALLRSLNAAMRVTQLAGLRYVHGVDRVLAGLKDEVEGLHRALWELTAAGNGYSAPLQFPSPVKSEPQARAS